MKIAHASLLLLSLSAFGLLVRGASAQDAVVVRVAGDPAMASIVQAWEQRFTAKHPGVRFENQLSGTDMAMGMLYGGKADLALLGRETNQVEDDSFLHSLGYTPIERAPDDRKPRHPA